MRKIRISGQDFAARLLRGDATRKMGAHNCLVGTEAQIDDEDHTDHAETKGRRLELILGVSSREKAILTQGGEAVLSLIKGGKIRPVCKLDFADNRAGGEGHDPDTLNPNRV